LYLTPYWIFFVSLREKKKTGMDFLDLEQQTQEVDAAIKRLTERIHSLRTPHLSDGTYDGSVLSRKCSSVCSILGNSAQGVECIKKCVRPVVAVKSVDAFRNDFPYDVQRLVEDPNLAKSFERHQLAASDVTIPDTREELDVILQLYTMPIAALLIPEEAWSRSLKLIQMPRNKSHKAKLLELWKQRKPDYPPHAWTELKRKIARHSAEK
jgi:hypothetical protein